MPKPEQTEKATPKRREEARKRGQVVRSQELGGAAIFLVTVFVLHGFYMQMINLTEASATTALSSLALDRHFTVTNTWLLFEQAGMGLGFILLIVFGIAMLVGIGVNIAQIGFLVTLKPLVPSFGKLNPANGLKRLFSKTVAVNLIKQLIKLGVVATLIFGAIAGNLAFFARLG